MYAGVDLSGRTRGGPHTAVVRVDEAGTVVDFTPGGRDTDVDDLWGDEGDRQLVDLCLGAAVVAIDAPLTLPPALRPSYQHQHTDDRPLPPYTRRDVDAVMGGMPFARLAGISARAIALRDRLRMAGTEVIETYPGLTARALSTQVPSAKEAVGSHRSSRTTPEERESALSNLRGFEDVAVEFSTHPAGQDLVDAALAVVVAHLYGNEGSSSHDIHTVGGVRLRATTVARAVADLGEQEIEDDVWFATWDSGRERV